VLLVSLNKLESCRCDETAFPVVRAAGTADDCTAPGHHIRVPNPLVGTNVCDYFLMTVHGLLNGLFLGKIMGYF
jgi:hypothetical protein